jgi:predicted amidohydrolase YtcJ
MSATMSETVVYPARLVRTGCWSRPVASAVAIRDGRILAVGDVEECRSWGPHRVDDRFADRFLVPGFVEAHSHTTEGQWASLAYVGWYDRRMADGVVVPGVHSVGALVERLRVLHASAASGETLMVGGFDPIFLDGPRLHRTDLDAVSEERPIFVFHASGHLATVNTALLRRYGLDGDHPSPGIGRDADGTPNGELREMGTLALAREEWKSLGRLLEDERTLRAFGASARNAGVTTATDLASGLLGRPEAIARWRSVVEGEDFPLRVVPACLVNPGRRTPEEQVALLEDLRAAEGDKLRFGPVKVVLDGSIQGFTAMVSWPGYYRGEDHGQFLVPPHQLADVIRPFHRAGITVHAHANGDLAADLFLDVLEQVLREHPWPDHRHTVQHAQLMTAAQLRRAAALGACVNFFVNHLWFWGDQHHDRSVGPERAHRMDPCGTALRLGVPFSLHSDAAVTPLGQLHTMWAAVNRMTPSGRVLGPDERITAADALHAVTIGAAYQLRLDHLIGSVEVGKLADLAVLAEDPLAVHPSLLRDVHVHGTVVGGVVHDAPHPVDPPTTPAPLATRTPPEA